MKRVYIRVNKIIEINKCCKRTIKESVLELSYSKTLSFYVLPMMI